MMKDMKGTKPKATTRRKAGIVTFSNWRMMIVIGDGNARSQYHTGGLRRELLLITGYFWT